MGANELAEEIKHRVPMRECAERYGFDINRSGFIHCPFHNEKTPSLKCYDGTRGFSCYGCGEYGSVIDFVQKLFGLNFNQAVARMDADFDLRLPIRQPLTIRERREAAARDKAWRDALAAEQAAANAVETAYWKALDNVRFIDRVAHLYRPKSENEDISPAFIAAKTARTRAVEALEEAEIKRTLYKRKRATKNTGMDSGGL